MLQVRPAGTPPGQRRDWRSTTFSEPHPVKIPNSASPDLPRVIVLHDVPSFTSAKRQCPRESPHGKKSGNRYRPVRRKRARVVDRRPREPEPSQRDLVVIAALVRVPMVSARTHERRRRGIPRSSGIPVSFEPCRFRTGESLRRESCVDPASAIPSANVVTITPDSALIIAWFEHALQVLRAAASDRSTYGKIPP